MKKIYNLFFVGGAKGVGKTRITSAACLDLGIERVETGKIVFDYISRNCQIDLNDYIHEELLIYRERNILVDTHYSAYPQAIHKIFTLKHKSNTKKFGVVHNRVIASNDEGFNIPIERLHNSIRERTKTFRDFTAQ